MHPELEGLLHAVYASQDDGLSLLVLLDWLEDHCFSKTAEAIRSGAAICSLEQWMQPEHGPRLIVLGVGLAIITDKVPMGSPHRYSECAWECEGYVGGIRDCQPHFMLPESVFLELSGIDKLAHPSFAFYSERSLAMTDLSIAAVRWAKAQAEHRFDRQ